MCFGHYTGTVDTLLYVWALTGACDWWIEDIIAGGCIPQRPIGAGLRACLSVLSGTQTAFVFQKLCPDRDWQTLGGWNPVQKSVRHAILCIYTRRNTAALTAMARVVRTVYKCGRR